jgi:aryl-alcohol dehydrogenase-like predicted oxidoreductase
LKLNKKIGRLGFGALHLNENSAFFLRGLNLLNRNANTFIDCAPYYAASQCFQKLQEIIKKNKSLKLTLAVKSGLKSKLKNGNHVSLPSRYLVSDLENIKKTIKHPDFSMCSFIFQFHQLEFKPNRNFLIKLSMAIKDRQFEGVGVANCNLHDFYWCLKKFQEHGIPFKTFQIHANLIELKHARKLCKLLMKYNITPVFNRVLARGALAYNTLKETPPKKSRILKSNRIKKWLSIEKKRKLEQFWKFCDKEGIGYVEFAIGYLLKRFEKSIVLVASPMEKKSLKGLKEALNFRLNSRRNAFADKLHLRTFPRYYFEK